jgi:hypothetical protein
VIPKILGLSAAILAVAFILALPGAFDGEPASEVMPIRIGPPPVQGLGVAREVDASTPAPARRRARRPGSARSFVDTPSVSAEPGDDGVPVQSTGAEPVPPPVRDSGADGVDNAQGTTGGRNAGGGGGAGRGGDDDAAVERDDDDEEENQGDGDDSDFEDEEEDEDD